MTLTYSLSTPDRAMIPRAPRQAVDFRVEIAGPTVNTFTTKVRNLSASGMLLHDAGGLRIGDVVSATLPDERVVVCAVVRLRKGGGAGLRFETAMSAA